jgi:hypothetical protein
VDTWAKRRRGAKPDRAELNLKRQRIYTNFTSQLYVQGHRPLVSAVFAAAFSTHCTPCTRRSYDLSLTFCHLRLNLTAPFQHPRKTTPFQTTLLPCGGSSDLNGRSFRCPLLGACYHYCWHYDRGSSYYKDEMAPAVYIH